MSRSSCTTPSPKTKRTPAPCARRHSEFARQLSAAGCGLYVRRYADLIEFVNGDGKLPEKPLLITIDDGYQNNLDLAAPLLEKYGFCANIAVIGVSIGHTTYKDTDIPITPHFSLEDALRGSSAAS